MRQSLYLLMSLSLIVGLSAMGRSRKESLASTSGYARPGHLRTNFIDTLFPQQPDHGYIDEHAYKVVHALSRLIYGEQYRRESAMEGNDYLSECAALDGGLFKVVSKASKVPESDAFKEKRLIKTSRWIQEYCSGIEGPRFMRPQVPMTVPKQLLLAMLGVTTVRKDPGMFSGREAQQVVLVFLLEIAAMLLRISMALPTTDREKMEDDVLVKEDNVLVMTGGRMQTLLYRTLWALSEIYQESGYDRLNRLMSHRLLEARMLQARHERRGRKREAVHAWVSSLLYHRIRERGDLEREFYVFYSSDKATLTQALLLRKNVEKNRVNYEASRSRETIA